MAKEDLVVLSFRMEVFTELYLNKEHKMLQDLSAWFSGQSYQDYFNSQRGIKFILEYQPNHIQEDREYK